MGHEWSSRCILFVYNFVSIYLVVIFHYGLVFSRNNVLHITIILRTSVKGERL